MGPMRLARFVGSISFVQQCSECSLLETVFDARVTSQQQPGKGVKPAVL
jgi:hypothetical protein